MRLNGFKMLHTDKYVLLYMMLRKIEDKKFGDLHVGDVIYIPTIDGIKTRKVIQLELSHPSLRVRLDNNVVIGVKVDDVCHPLSPMSRCYASFGESCMEDYEGIMSEAIKAHKSRLKMLSVTRRKFMGC